MSIFLVLVGLAVFALAEKVIDAFQANELFNGLILFVLVLGILYIFLQVWRLNPEVAWLDRLRRESKGGLVFPGSLSEDRPPRLLGPMANMLGDRAGRLSLSTLSMRTLLDGIHSRIEESHELSRYLIGLLIFLGLLGTFWGLLETVTAVADTIGGLNGAIDDPASLFEELKSGLATPLAGMGTAFSSSLFGLAGSLVLGFLELQAGQAHNRFLNELEEWLSGVTKLSTGSIGSDGDQSVPAYIQALLEKTADSLDQLQRTISRGEEDRSSMTQGLAGLTDRMSTLTDQMRAEQSVLMKMAENQSQLKQVMSKLAENEGGAGSAGLDEASRGHLRNVDLRLERIANDLSSGRENAIQEIRGEIRLLTRTIAAIAEESE
ncbi:flagellar motor protein MotA [Pelagibius sp. Alg239-R121]|uniref:flagellar motor protein MotA n=1 Tax=Pelagibius sp. Alg239-R121 TaxID=2993448 RepID=UPI0024A703DD|nr:flagellar motor protein MotA [Pelagibius sp. Alg239-R121]